MKLGQDSAVKLVPMLPSAGCRRGLAGPAPREKLEPARGSRRELGRGPAIVSAACDTRPRRGWQLGKKPLSRGSEDRITHHFRGQGTRGRGVGRMGNERLDEAHWASCWLGRRGDLGSIVSLVGFCLPSLTRGRRLRRRLSLVARPGGALLDLLGKAGRLDREAGSLFGFLAFIVRQAALVCKQEFGRGFSS